jgi:hypothetical protein
VPPRSGRNSGVRRGGGEGWPPLTAAASCPRAAECAPLTPPVPLPPAPRPRSYKVQDSANNAGSVNYTYFFNICNDFDPSILPGAGWAPGKPGPSTVCNQTYTNGAGQPPIGMPGPAFQYANFLVPDADQCHRLGASVGAAPGGVSYGLYDSDNPSRGVYIKYAGGDVCASGARRSLKVWILCDTDVTNVPDTELVEETSMCDYEIFVASAFGCPVECPVNIDPVSGARSLCSNHGICDFDGALRTSRCFCNNGWEGRDCSAATVPPPALSAVGVVLICVGLFLAGTLGFL